MPFIRCGLWTTAPLSWLVTPRYASLTDQTLSIRRLAGGPDLPLPVISSQSRDKNLSRVGMHILYHFIQFVGLVTCDINRPHRESVVGLVSSGEAEDMNVEVEVEGEGSGKRKRRVNTRYAGFWTHANDKKRGFGCPGD
ncbi:hypothetical protein B0H14DRAFT_2650581 [Mycena olivaceomarginata]|nr:hypothetical protein B0H14DRAFT_2650581 [Mycena olivaceomarginata]